MQWCSNSQRLSVLLWNPPPHPLCHHDNNDHDGNSPPPPPRCSSTLPAWTDGAMSNKPRYSVLSLPLGVFDSSDKDDAITALRATVSADNGNVFPFPIPDFKIGTLDALVQQADDLGKLEATCESVVTKVAESLRSVLGTDEDRNAQYRMVNDSESFRGTLWRFALFHSSLTVFRRANRQLFDQL